MVQLWLNAWQECADFSVMALCPLHLTFVECGRKMDLLQSLINIHVIALSKLIWQWAVRTWILITVKAKMKIKYKENENINLIMNKLATRAYKNSCAPCSWRVRGCLAGCGCVVELGCFPF